MQMLQLQSRTHNHTTRYVNILRKAMLLPGDEHDDTLGI